MRDPAVIKDLVRLHGIDSDASKQMLERLQTDVQNCVDCDQVYSPKADAKRQLMGTCLELILHPYAQ